MEKKNKKKNTKTKSKIVVEKKKGFNSYETVGVAFLTLIIGLFIGLAISFGAGKYTKNSKIKAIEEAYSKILNNGYTEIKEEDLTDKAIEGMMSLADDNSMYIKETDYLEDYNGYYNGIGISICRQEDGLVYVVDVNETGPSIDILQVGDQIISFNDWIMDDYDTFELSSEIKELPVGTNIEVKVMRNGELLTYNIPTKTVTIKTVSNYYISEDNFGYIKLDYISSNTHIQVKEALDKFNENNVDKLILDLRCNTGGDVNSLKNIASFFLENNTIIYKQVVNKEEKNIRSSGDPIFKGKIVVLIDDYTASAAEILAATLKDNLKAVLVGTRSYGKYTIQTTYTLSNDSVIKYTIGEWLRIDGTSVKDTGLVPDRIVENEESIDNQFIQAVEEVKKD